MSYMYLIVNSSVKMSKGKTAAQVGHVVQRITEYMVLNKPQQWNNYKNSGMAKIVLRASEEDIIKMIMKYGTINGCDLMKNNKNNKTGPISYIIDAGRTQIPPNTLTVIGFCPIMIKKDMILNYPELATYKLL